MVLFTVNNERNNETCQCYAWIHSACGKPFKPNTRRLGARCLAQCGWGHFIREEFFEGFAPPMVGMLIHERCSGGAQRQATWPASRVYLGDSQQNAGLLVKRCILRETRRRPVMRAVKRVCPPAQTRRYPQVASRGALWAYPYCTRRLQMAINQQRSAVRLACWSIHRPGRFQWNVFISVKLGDDSVKSGEEEGGGGEFVVTYSGLKGGVKWQRDAELGWGGGGG